MDLHIPLQIWPPVLAVSLALMLDYLLGEPRRWHPVCGLGRLIKWSAVCFYKDSKASGIVVVAMLTLPWTLLWFIPLPWYVDAVILYFAIAGRSLGEHGRYVSSALLRDDINEAREKVSWLVSRKTEQLNETQIASATVESVLENGNDAVFGALFWYLIAGAPGVIIYRITNTLDASWGYKNAKWKNFGWAAARLDDLLNYLPARLTVLTYALQGNVSLALKCAWVQGRQCASPNGGPVMAAGAGALAVTIGGAAEYDGYRCDKPKLGKGPAATAQTIEKAIRLVFHGSLLWLLTLWVLTVFGVF